LPSDAVPIVVWRGRKSELPEHFYKDTDETSNVLFDNTQKVHIVTFMEKHYVTR